MNALPEYVSPVPAVVVAPEDTTPPNTANPPFPSDGRLSVPIVASVVEAFTNEAYAVDDEYAVVSLPVISNVEVAVPPK